MKLKQVLPYLIMLLIVLAVVVLAKSETVSNTNVTITEESNTQLFSLWGDLGGSLSAKDDSFLMEFGVLYTNKAHEITGTLGLIHQKARGVVYTSRRTIRLGYDYDPNKWTYFVFVKHVTDPPDSIMNRVQFAGGAKYTIFDALAIDGSLSLAPIYQYDQVIDYDTLTITEERHDIRWSLRPKLDILLSPEAELKMVLFWQPNITDMNDYITDAQVKFVVSASENVSMALGYDHIFDSVGNSHKDIISVSAKMSAGWIK